MSNADRFDCFDELLSYGMSQSGAREDDELVMQCRALLRELREARPVCTVNNIGGRISVNAATNAFSELPDGAQLFAHPPAPAPSCPEGWQPIETAPRDGTDILIFSSSVHEARWIEVGRSIRMPGFYWAGYSSEPVGPLMSATYWCHLPAAPSAPGDKT